MLYSIYRNWQRCAPGPRLLGGDGLGNGKHAKFRAGRCDLFHPNTHHSEKGVAFPVAEPGEKPTAGLLAVRFISTEAHSSSQGAYF